jgi:predicted membrane protein
MQEASITGFFRTVLIILAVIYGLKFFVRYVVPLLLIRAVNKAKDRAQAQQNYNQPNDTKVGETVIDKKNIRNQQNTNSIDDMGEYVDYEEVE